MESMDAFYTLTVYYGHAKKMAFTKLPYLGHGHAQNIQFIRSQMVAVIPYSPLNFHLIFSPLYFANKSLGYSHRFYVLRLKLAQPDHKFQMANRWKHTDYFPSQQFSKYLQPKHGNPDRNNGWKQVETMGVLVSQGELVDHSNNVDHEPLGIHFLNLLNFKLALSFEMAQALNMQYIMFSSLHQNGNNKLQLLWHKSPTSFTCAPKLYVL